ncbi:TPA: hypothetical protein QE959_000185 [Staphylococcus aureus]|nr:hypothetical protein [Staphylococcus aureus]HDF3554676.1 hypothetical protein [Staphylococcus aureus]HDT6951109.1 hypothetical protein [Staphylococcus aureus]HDT6956285.1 hypothetical protein [Staphylococcus aureus]HDT6961625.1 hypothetical protein [Staphylococcus aureus]
MERKRKHFNKEFAKSNLTLNNEKWKFVCLKIKTFFLKRAVKL